MTVYGALCNAVHRLYQGALHSQNIEWFHGQCKCNFTHAHQKSMAFHMPLFMKCILSSILCRSLI